MAKKSSFGHLVKSGGKKRLDKSRADKALIKGLIEEFWLAGGIVTGILASLWLLSQILKTHEGAYRGKETLIP